MEAIFQSVVDLSPAEQARILDDRCAGDPVIRQRVEVLLAHDAAVPANFLAGATPASDADATDVGLPVRIGHYHIIGVIGEGGMGVVYEARQENPSRVVALKVIRPEFQSPATLRRFEHEAHILGQLQHPGIACIHEAGVAEVVGAGIPRLRQPFFAMERVRGEPLGAYIRSRSPTVAQRVELVAKICDAVHHAHQKGIIHRDLKPGNILVVEGAGPDEAIPKVLDFGVARIVSTDLEAVTLQTGMGQLLGTLPYMSPEQVTGDSRLIDARTDVYAIGVMLYEMLAGRLPHEVRHCAIPEALRLIREQEPTHLSSLNTAFRGDLDTIVTKALEKERDRRYSSAAALGEDLRRFLRDEPIVARRQTTGYHLRKFARRNQALVTGVMIAFAAISLGAVAATWQAVAARKAERLASRQAYLANVTAAESALRVYDPIAARQRLEAIPERSRDTWEWRYLHTRLDRSRVTLGPMPARVQQLAMSPDGILVGAALDDGCIALWAADEVRTGETRKHLLISTGARTKTPELVFAPNGNWMAHGGDDGVVRLWDTDRIADELEQADGMRPLGAGAMELLKFPMGAPYVQGLAFDAAGERLIAASGEVLHVWNIPDGKLLQRTPGCPMGPMISPRDPSKLLITRWGVAAALIDLADPCGSPDFFVHDAPITGLAMTDDRRRWLTASADKTVRIWDAATQQPLATLAGHSSPVWSAAFSPDGRFVASACADHTLRLADAESGSLLDVFLGHTDAVYSVIFMPDGTHFLSGGADRSIRLWRMAGSEAAESLLLLKHQSFVYDVAFSPDGTRAASAGWDGCIRIWTLPGFEEQRVLPHSLRIEDVDFAPDGKRLASVVLDETIRLWDVETGGMIDEIKSPTGGFPRVRFSPDGNSLLLSGILPSQVWDTRERKWSRPLPGLPGIDVIAGGRLQRIGKFEKSWYSQSDSEPATRTELQGQPEAVNGIAFSSDGQLAATANPDGTVRVFACRDGRSRYVLHGHLAGVLCVAFSPDGTRLASGSQDNTIRLWDMATGTQVLELRGHASYVKSLDFSPDGSLLISGSGDSTVRVWRAASTLKSPKP